MMNEVAENVLVCVISYVGPFVFGKYKGREGSPGWRVAACSALVDSRQFFRVPLLLSPPTSNARKYGGILNCQNHI